MPIAPNEKAFKQAEALIKDAIFKINFNKSDPNDLKLFKLLQARLNNLDFEAELAEFICGEQNNSFPYRSSFFLTRFFTDLGFSYTHTGQTRRFWVAEVLMELSIDQIAYIIEKGLFNKRDFVKLAKDKVQTSVEETYQKAISEFKNFIDNSLQANPSVDLFAVLELNINMELLFDKQLQTEDSQLNNLIREAKERFFYPNDKHVALEKLWDAFERVKTYYDADKKQSSKRLLDFTSREFDYETLKKEFVELTGIGNKFRIRHHETDKIEITDNKHINYLFFRMLSLIDLCLTSINENK